MDPILYISPITAIQFTPIVTLSLLSSRPYISPAATTQTSDPLLLQPLSPGWGGGTQVPNDYSLPNGRAEYSSQIGDVNSFEGKRGGLWNSK